MSRHVSVVAIAEAMASTLRACKDVLGFAKLRRSDGFALPAQERFEVEIAGEARATARSPGGIALEVQRAAATRTRTPTWRSSRSCWCLTAHGKWFGARNGLKWACNHARAIPFRARFIEPMQDGQKMESNCNMINIAFDVLLIGYL